LVERRTVTMRSCSASAGPRQSARRCGRDHGLLDTVAGADVVAADIDGAVEGGVGDDEVCVVGSELVGAELVVAAVESEALVDDCGPPLVTGVDGAPLGAVLSVGADGLAYFWTIPRICSSYPTIRS
jgi:hypothetical protein